MHLKGCAPPFTLNLLTSPGQQVALEIRPQLYDLFSFAKVAYFFSAPRAAATCRFLCGESLFIPGCKAPRLQSPVVGRLRKPSPQFSPPPGVSQGFWLYQGSGAPVLDTTPRTFHDAQGPSRTYHCLDWRERWAHNLRLRSALSPKCPSPCVPCTLLDLCGSSHTNAQSTDAPSCFRSRNG